MVDDSSDAADDAVRAVGPSAPAPRAARTFARRFLAWTAVVLSAVVLVGTTVAYGAYRHYGGQIGTVEGLPRLQDAPRADDGLLRGRHQPGRNESYLVVGSDSVAGLTDEQLREVGTTRRGRDVLRTDTILLVQVPADGSRARVVSFPRDSWVPVTGHGRAKLNAAYDLGEEARPGSGPSTLIATVERLSGVQVDHYVEVSLYGFVRITDALGGVEVCLSEPAVEPDAQIDLPAGRQRLEGREALAFVRQRKELPGGDLGRIRRQQHFLSSAAREVLDAGALLDALALDRLLTAVTSSVRVDPGGDERDLLRLAEQLRGITAGAIRFQTLPVLDADARIDGQSVVLLHEAALPAFFADVPPPAPSATPAAPPPPPLPVPPSAIGLVLENGTATPGFAATVAPQVRQVGFRVLAVRDAARSDHAQTLVRYGAQREDSARTTAAALPGSALVRDDSVGPRGLVVTLGSRWSGARRVAVEPAGQAGPGSASRPRTAAEDDCIP